MIGIFPRRLLERGFQIRTPSLALAPAGLTLLRESPLLRLRPLPPHLLRKASVLKIGWSSLGDSCWLEFPIATRFLRKTIRPPFSRVNLQSPWPRLRVKRGSFGGSADLLACYLARRWHSSPRDDDSSTVSSLSLLVRYPFGSAATLRNMLPKRCRVRCPSASSSQ